MYLERFGIHTDCTGNRERILGEEPAGGNRRPTEAVGAGEEGSSWQRLGTCRSATASAGRRWGLCHSRLRSFFDSNRSEFWVRVRFRPFRSRSPPRPVQNFWRREKVDGVCVGSALKVVWRVCCGCYTAATIWPETLNPCLLDLDLDLDWVYSLFEPILK